MSTKSEVFGIDLGTTNTCLCRFSPEQGFEMIPIDDSPLLPSYIAFDGQDWLFGRSARNYSKINPQSGVKSFKRAMGDPSYQVELGGQVMTASDLSCLLLKYLKTQAEKHLGRPIEDVVITVPAWFTDAQRRGTLEAGKNAGFHVLRIINEPTASALAYEIADSDQHQTSENWLVYDLGGGTFDVSVLRVQGQIKEVLASCGNTFLGGDDFDRQLVHHLLNELQNKHGKDFSKDPVIIAKLTHIAEDAKICLSTEPEIRVHDSVTFKDHVYSLDLQLSRDKFEALIEDFIRSSLQKVEQVLADAKLTPSEIDRLLLVGGSTRIPVIRSKLAELFESEADARVDPDLSVAIGAATQAAICQGLNYQNIVVDVSPHSLGIAVMGELDNPLDMFLPDIMSDEPAAIDMAKTFAPLIRRNSKLPARFVNRFYTSIPDQSQVQIVVLQGESKLSFENNLVGSFMVDIEPTPQIQAIDIGFSYDLNGLVRISIAAEKNKTQVHNFTVNLAYSTINAGLTGDLNETIDRDIKPEGQNLASNFLIEKVEQRLANLPASEHSPWQDLLEDYRQALLNEDDASLDDLEDRLYQWLEV